MKDIFTYNPLETHQRISLSSPSTRHSPRSPPTTDIYRVLAPILLLSFEPGRSKQTFFHEQFIRISATGNDKLTRVRRIVSSPSRVTQLRSAAHVIEPVQAKAIKGPHRVLYLISSEPLASARNREKYSTRHKFRV
ncbi:hypothetical protein Trydic_g606 [Trypoxylus dichotomus]